MYYCGKSNAGVLSNQDSDSLRNTVGNEVAYHGTVHHDDVLHVRISW